MTKKYSIPSGWEAVIGLEIHAELNTKSKLFSSAPNRFGDEPNSNISPVCVALPGALPVLNKEAVKKAVQFGCAINAHIAEKSLFDRKSYFYPDCPRNFQITQFYHPIIEGGSLVTLVEGEEKEFAINRAHLEDDAGMLKHFSSFAGVDYNRAGVPLLEIVTEPCMHTPKEASSCASAIKAILEAVDASDCNMQEGSLRIDVNISVRKKGETALRNKIEIKNMNSFSNLEKAVRYEILRQIEEYEKHSALDPSTVITPSTFRFDPTTMQTVLMRRKEGADDYRYFPEPDLLPLVIEKSYIEEIRKNKIELPLHKQKRYMDSLGLSTQHAYNLAYNKKSAFFFEKCLSLCSSEKAKSIANWMLVEFAGRLKDKNLHIEDSSITPELLSTLIHLIDSGEITGKIAKSIADKMVEEQKDPQQIINENPHFMPIHDEAHLLPLVEEVLAANPESVASYLSGRDRAFAFLVGQIMKKTQGAASPQLVNKLLKEKINNKQK